MIKLNIHKFNYFSIGELIYNCKRNYRIKYKACQIITLQ